MLQRGVGLRRGGAKELKSGGNRAAYYKRVITSIANDEGKYQLLCANCNWIKRYEDASV